MAAIVVFLAGFAVYKIVEVKKERKEEKRRAAAGIPPSYKAASENAARSSSKRKQWRNKLSGRKTSDSNLPKDVKIPSSETASIAPPAYA